MSATPTQVVPATQMMAPAGSNETAATAVAAQAKALVEARYTVALHRPRDLDTVRQRMLKECQRPSFADVARYRKPIGAGIEGPSIRFAEMALRCMSNIAIDTMTVYDDREKRIVRVAVTDLESNISYSLDVTIEKTVERRSVKAGDEVLRSRQNSGGQTVHIIVGTEDDILNKQNALISKAIRTQGLRQVPGDIVDECMTVVKRVQKDHDAADPDAAKRRLFDAFGEIGIKVADLKEYLGTDAGVLTPKELADLRGLYAAIKDGEATWREAMEQKAAAAGTKPPVTDPGKGGVSKLKGAVGGKPDPGPTAAVDTGTGEAMFSFEGVQLELQNAGTLSALEEAADLIREIPNADQRTQLTATYTARKLDLEKELGR